MPVVAMLPVPKSVLLEQLDVLIPKLKKLAVQMEELGESKAVPTVVLAENVILLLRQPQPQPQHQSLPQ